MRKTFNDTEKFLKHDVRFHQALAAAAGNKVMGNVMDTVAGLLLQIRREAIARSKEKGEALDWHEQIYEAVRQGEARHDKELITAHLVAAEKEWVKATQKPPASKSKKPPRQQ